MNKRDKCIEIYREAFGCDEPDFEKRLFENCFSDCVYLEKDGMPATMLFALPCNIEKENERFSAIYIYAAATLKKLRGQGLMTQLLEKLKAESNSLLFLRPANEELITFYKNCGFKVITAFCKNSGFPRVEPSGSFSKLTAGYSFSDGKQFTLMYFSKNDIDIDNLNFIYSME